MRPWPRPDCAPLRSLTGLGLTAALLLTACSPVSTEPAPPITTAAATSAAASPDASVPPHASVADSTSSASTSAETEPEPLLSGARQKAPAVDPALLAAALDPALHLSQGTLGAAVVDVQTGELLYGQNEDAPLIPASSLKVLTAMAALTVFGPEHTFRTRAIADPQEDGSMTVVLDGGGDVLLGSGDSDPDAVLGRAGLGSLAEDTVATLADWEITGPVTVQVDDSDFEGQSIHPQWPASTLNVDISAVTSLATYGGRVEGQKWGQRVSDPALYAGQVYRDALAAEAQRQGVDLHVADQVDRVSPPETPRPEEGTLAYLLTTFTMAQVESAPLAEQARFMLQESDNVTAEAFGRSTAAALGESATFEGATAAIRTVLAETDPELDLTGLQLSDASGLSAHTTVTAAQLADAVRVAGRSPETIPVIEGLPVAGRDGTLEHRMVGTAAEGTARAKTGTLGSVATLTGAVVTAEGRELAFSLLANDLNGGLGEARSAMDRAVATMAECGCGGD